MTSILKVRKLIKENNKIRMRKNCDWSNVCRGEGNVDE